MAIYAEAYAAVEIGGVGSNEAIFCEGSTSVIIWAEGFACTRGV